MLPRRLLILTDLDGSLLDASTYSHQPAEEALDGLRRLNCPLVLVSSKTRAEIEPIRFRLNNHCPFAAENGGGVFIPKGYFPFPIENSVLRGEYQVIECGTPYITLRVALKEMGQQLGCSLQGFGDLSAEDIARHTGLSPADAHLAKQREYDEPFIVPGDEDLLDLLRGLAEARGLQCTRGGRFYHLMGTNDKGRAGRLILDYFQQLAAMENVEFVTVGIGDSLNDLPLLEVVDRPVLVQKPDGTYDPGVCVPNLLRAPGIGPHGWNRAVLDLLELTPSRS